MKSSILLVEDDAEILEEIREDLAEYFTVFSASNGRDGLSIVANQHIALVVSDVMMPVMDGFELCSAIKSSTDFCHIPVILLTARTTLTAKIEGLGLGADAYIDKPFDMDYLLAVIGTLLKNRQMVRDFFVCPTNTDRQPLGKSLEDIIFVQELSNITDNLLDDIGLDTSRLSKMMGVSRTNLFKKIKATTGLTPNDFINLTRLKKAAEIFQTSNLSVNEVAQMVGYNSTTNFGRNFQKHFCMTPSKYRQQLKK